MYRNAGRDFARVISNQERKTFMIPKDPVMLLSYLNTQLRDHYSSLEDLCRSLDLDEQHITASLASIQYVYDAGRNQFI